MSDSKRATLITVGAPKSAKNNVNKTVRLSINLVESNESKYPELNYKELVIAEDCKKKIENGKTPGLDPFSDNDDDVKQVASKFEQKYGGKSTYGKTGRSKKDEFADIGAGYDENDSFIDNTDGYDEMIPPECDTLYGGFYINSGSLEFKTVTENHVASSDAEPNRRNKRRISSSSSEEESSGMSSESSQDEKNPKPTVNGVVDTHKTEHRKKKNKKIELKKAKKIRRNDSSAATSGKQTSDDNAHESADSRSRTSQSDSLTSKPAPSSENVATSDSSRDVDPKVEVKLPPAVALVLEELETAAVELCTLPPKELETRSDPLIQRLDRILSKCGAARGVTKAAWNRAARCLNTTRTKLLQRTQPSLHDTPTQAPAPSVLPPVTITATSVSTKRKTSDDLGPEDFSSLTAEEREEKIVETLQKLKALIEDRKPGMIGSYNAECERVREERKKMKLASETDGAPQVEKRMPKRRFPWCPRSRALLGRLRDLATGSSAAAALLASRALPLFPSGFVRMPTLLRQADLNKEIKAAPEVKRPRLGSASQPTPFSEPIQFPSALTVITTTRSADPAPKELYTPPDQIGSITITAVPLSKDKKPSNHTQNPDKHKEGLIRVKSPAALNEMVKKDQEKVKKPDKNHIIKEKKLETPLHVDTSSYQINKKEPSPKTKDEITQKQIESMRIAENNIPRPALVPVHHSPTFAKPDKRPPEVKKKKDVVIISDVDPLGDVQLEPLAVDDSSSDVEVIEEKTDKCELNVGDNKSDTVPSKDKVNQDNLKKVNNVKISKAASVVKDGKSDRRSDSVDEPYKEDFANIRRNLKEMEHSKEPPKLNSNSYDGVITSAKREMSSSQPFGGRPSIFGDPRSDKDKFAERTSLNRMDGCSVITG